jgi:hypothetical protein
MLDRMASQQLAGEAIDTKSFIAASQELERMLGSDPTAPSSRFASVEAREKLRKLIECTVLTPSASDHERDAERSARDEMQAIAAAGGDAAAAAPPDWQPAPAGGDGDAAVSSHAANGDAKRPSRAGTGGAPAAPQLAEQ